MDFINKHKRGFVVSSISLCILLMIITVLFRENPSYLESVIGYIVVPFEKVNTNVGNFFSEKIDFFTNMNRLSYENTVLKRENEELRAENEKLSLYENENAELRKLLSLDEKYPDYPKIASEVIMKDPGNWYEIFVIDKGSSNGISKNMPIIANGGLVGKVFEASSNYSKIIPIIDDSSSVSAQSKRTGAYGYVKGETNYIKDGLCIMEYIDINAEIIEGDEIVTSDLSQYYPPGITIGTIIEIKTDIKGLNKYAIIEPVVDFKNIKKVFIINRVFEKEGITSVLEEN